MNSPNTFKGFLKNYLYSLYVVVSYGVALGRGLDSWVCLGLFKG